MNEIFAWGSTAIVSYLVGSIPFSYILAKWKTGKDLRVVGSGNVGARNLYDVTKNLPISIIAAFSDAAKGAAAVLFSSVSFPSHCDIIAGSLVFAVFGHNYPVWLKFKGGRGLATALGGFLLFHPLPILLFAVMWLTGYFVIRKNVHVANVTGALGTPILLWSTPQFYLETLRTIDCVSSSLLLITTLLVCLQIFVRHIEPMQKLFQDEKSIEENH